MFEVYTTVPGLVMQIGTFGLAKNDEPALVPEDVAAGIEDEIRGFRIEEHDGKRVEMRFPSGPGRPDGREVRLRVKKIGEPKPAKAPAGKIAPPPAGQGEKRE